MTDVFKLAQISDVHLSPITGFTPRYWNAKRTLGYLNWLKNRQHVHRRETAELIARDIAGQSPDYIAVTGDLANLGLPGEYAKALDWLQVLGGPHRVSVIPGNHDIYSTGLGPVSCLDDWADYMRSNGQPPAEKGRATFPYVRRFGKIAIIGLNSAYPTPLFIAAGRVGEEQLAVLATCLDTLRAEDMTRVVLIHHPPLPGQTPPRRALTDAEALQKVLQSHGAELVLHGHNHRDMYATIETISGTAHAIGIASGSAARVHKGEPLARYNLISLAHRPAETRIEIVTRGLLADGSNVGEIAKRSLVTRSKR